MHIVFSGGKVLLMPGKKPVRSPLHPEALTLKELHALQRGLVVVVCTYEGRELAHMDAVNFMGITKGLWTGGSQAYPGFFVVFDSVPKHIKRSTNYHELGLGLVGVDVISHGLRHLRKLYEIKQGCAFNPRNIGLVQPSLKAFPFTDEWPRYCVIRTEHM